jgi:Fe(II)/alpha-ketoglutarate-dependent arginine beta-hydroxylase
VKRLDLQPEDLEVIERITRSIASEFTSVESDEFLARAPLLAHRLPDRVREFLLRLHAEEFPVGIISGHRIDDQAIGPTPEHWQTRTVPSPTLALEAIIVLYGSLLGDVFGWATQQDGRLVHEVLPIRGYEHEQVGFSSEETLTWHTEDAFHPLRGDYLILGCLRNPYDVPTTVGILDEVCLNSDDEAILFQPRFIIKPDNSHTPQNNTVDDLDAFNEIQRMNEQPDPISVLYGADSAPYMRLDPYFMDIVDGDQAAAAALEALVQEFDLRMNDVVLQPGDVCILDNFRVVHGRKPFSARFDGTDRWLKRINVTRDLRKSRHQRATVGSRIIR